jgi:hypothetical protein
VVLAATVQVTPVNPQVPQGSSLQLVATARDANGTVLTGRPVTWVSLAPGMVTVSATGLVTGVSPGPATIQATVDTAHGSTVVQDDSSTGLQPWLAEDFGTYLSTVDLLADPRHIYSVGEDLGTGQIALDPTTGYGTSTQSMRYTFPDRTTDSTRCGDYPIGRNINLPSVVKEVWVEVYVKFSANFQTLAPGAWGCTSNAEYKFIFGRTDGGSRFNLNAGTYGNAWTFGIPFDEQGAGGTPPNVVAGADRVWDGQWHQYRLYFKVSSASGVSDGAARFYLDGTLIKSYANVAINDTDIYGVALGRNMNQGPAQPSYVWWGRIRIWNQNAGW